MNSVTQTQENWPFETSTLSVPKPLVKDVVKLVAEFKKDEKRRQAVILEPLAKVLYESYSSVYKVGHGWGGMAPKRRAAWVAVAANAMKLADIRQKEALESLLFLAQDALEKNEVATVDAKQVEITCIEGLGGEE